MPGSDYLAMSYARKTFCQGARRGIGGIGGGVSQGRRIGTAPGRRGLDERRMGKGERASNSTQGEQAYGAAVEEGRHRSPHETGNQTSRQQAKT